MNFFSFQKQVKCYIKIVYYVIIGVCLNLKGFYNINSFDLLLKHEAQEHFLKYDKALKRYIKLTLAASCSLGLITYGGY